MKVYGLFDLQHVPFVMLSATFSDTEREILNVSLSVKANQMISLKTQREIISGRKINTLLNHIFNNKMGEAFDNLTARISGHCGKAP